MLRSLQEGTDQISIISIISILSVDVLISPSCHRHARTEGLRTIHFNSTACVASELRSQIESKSMILEYSGYCIIIMIGKYPPAPADARGSAPGNKTSKDKQV